MNAFLENQFGLAGKRALVTGAARGIGRAIAEALCAAGAEVCIHFNKSEGEAKKLVAQLESQGGRVFAVGGDLTDSKQADTLIAKIESRWNGLDILVNNAGDLVQRSKVEAFSDDLLDRVVKLNFHSAVYVTRRAIPLLRRGIDPSIINLSSVAAHNGGSNGATIYAATKAAIHTYTRGLAKELAPAIRVNAISPGVALTDFHRTHTTPEALETIAGNTPLKRLGTAEDHGAAVVFLCGKGASFITGEVIEINGGLWLA
ncbi:MAG TPA: SDR family oxidoreductase [Tepidisphaeraceae bacterium]|jgi:3-oxoacyl-[acyl-carrier protein] reductase|nr:SDR family oxidoreductase [Tepidisphaeraceae bacterium]